MQFARYFLYSLLLTLAACAAPKYTVDDGRQVDEKLLHGMHVYGQGERALRPAIARSAALRDSACDRQWELHFAVATSDGWVENDRVAWVRALGVDERLSVIAVAPDVALQVGDKISAIDGKSSEGSEKMLEALVQRRDAGRPFTLTLVNGRQPLITPFEVCRGYARFAPPNTPKLQDYHWLMNMHPLELSEVGLNEDQALWLVLWGQGLSEEGGARMKTYHYGSKIVGTLYNLATLASGLKGAALAADAAVTAAKNAAANVAGELLKQQLIEQGKALAAQRLRAGLVDTAQSLTRTQVLDMMQAAATNRGSLSGVARIGATVFDRADAWAYERMQKLGANPLAGFELHQKLLEHRLAGNAFLLDAERLDALTKYAGKQGQAEAVTAILRGLKPADLLTEMGAMPLASVSKTFSFDSEQDPGHQPATRGLVEALLEMPVESLARK